MPPVFRPERANTLARHSAPRSDLAAFIHARGHLLVWPHSAWRHGSPGACVTGFNIGYLISTRHYEDLAAEQPDLPIRFFAPFRYAYAACIGPELDANGIVRYSTGDGNPCCCRYYSSGSPRVASSF
jgi:hypothetical protein